MKIQDYRKYAKNPGGKKNASKEGRPGRGINIAEEAAGCTPRQPKRVEQ